MGMMGKIKFPWEVSNFYRGTVPGSTERIREVFDAGAGKTFVARNPESAKMYGNAIETIPVPDGAKILYQESPDFWRLIGKRKPPNGAIESVKGGVIQNVNDAIRRAEQAGYDAISFSNDSGIGTVLLNEGTFKRNVLKGLMGVGSLGAASFISPERANAEALQEPTFDPISLLAGPAKWGGGLMNMGIDALMRYFSK